MGNINFPQFLFLLIFFIHVDSSYTKNMVSELETNNQFKEDIVPFFYVKSHKTGSTTVASLLRIGAERRKDKYHCFIPPVHIASHIWKASNQSSLNHRYLMNSNPLFNCWTLHSILEKPFLNKYISPNVLIITSFRNPIKRVISAFDHYIKGKKRKTIHDKKEINFESWVLQVYKNSSMENNQNVEKGSTKGLFGSCDNVSELHEKEFMNLNSDSPHYGFNGMTSQLLPFFYSSNCNDALHQLFIKIKEQEWCVVILERLDESLIILKDRLGWNQDITRNKSNINTNAAAATDDNDVERKKKKDYLFSDFAYQPLNTKVERSGDSYELYSDDTLELVKQLSWRDYFAYNTAWDALQSAIDKYDSVHHIKSNIYSSNNHIDTDSDLIKTEVNHHINDDSFQRQVDYLVLERNELESYCSVDNRWITLKSCSERKYNDKEWAYHHKLDQDEVENVDMSKEEGKSESFESKIVKALEKELPLIAKCDCKVDLNDDGERYQDKRIWTPLLCSIAHYTLPHKVKSVPWHTTFSISYENLKFDTQHDRLGEGCHNESSINHINNGVALVRRGGCSFTCKAYWAQEKGFTSLIMIDFTSMEKIDETENKKNEDKSHSDITPQTPMIAGKECSNTDQDIEIPVLMLNAKTLLTYFDGNLVDNDLILKDKVTEVIVSEDNTVLESQTKPQVSSLPLAPLLKIRVSLDREIVPKYDFFTVVNTLQNDITERIESSIPSP